MHSLASTWWRHQMETFSALLALCAGNSPVQVNSPHKGQWRWALMFTLICARINDWVNNREAGDLRRLLDHYDVSVMRQFIANQLDIIQNVSFTTDTSWGIQATKSTTPSNISVEVVTRSSGNHLFISQGNSDFWRKPYVRGWHWLIWQTILMT